LIQVLGKFLLVLALIFGALVVGSGNAFSMDLCEGPNTLGEDSQSWCGEWQAIPPEVSAALGKMKAKSHSSPSYSEAWTTELKVFKLQYTLQRGYSQHDLRYLLAAFKIPRSEMSDLFTKFYARADKVLFDKALHWNGICHDQEKASPIETYLQTLLGDNPAIILQMGSLVRFQLNEQYTIVIAGEYVVYMKHVRYGPKND
jgi:hypothetical protein